MDVINIRRYFDIEYMCKHQTNYFPESDKVICEKYLSDNIITMDILVLWCESRIENVGDMVDGNMTFRYTEDGSDVTIIGRWNDENEYPAEIISKEGKIINKNKVKSENR